MNVELAVEIALVLIKHFEGFYPRPYLCSAGVATIGYGTTRYPNGVAVTLRDSPITHEQAIEYMLHEVRRNCVPALIKLCPGADTAERAAALIDFLFNLGSGNLKASTLRRRVNEQDWNAARVEILRWCKAAGRELKGLKRRREAEAQLL